MISFIDDNNKPSPLNHAKISIALNSLKHVDVYTTNKYKSSFWIDKIDNTTYETNYRMVFYDYSNFSIRCYRVYYNSNDKRYFIKKEK